MSKKAEVGVKSVFESDSIFEPTSQIHTLFIKKNAFLDLKLRN